MFPLVTALPSTHSAAHRGALFVGFFGTMLVSDCSGPYIIGVELGSSRCGPPNHRVASPELSQFPRKECTRMPRLSDRAEPEKHSRFRAPRCCLPPAHQRRRSGLTAFAARYPAYARPYRLLVCLLTETSARLGADVVRSTFIVEDLHLLLLASLLANLGDRSHRLPSILPSPAPPGAPSPPGGRRCQSPGCTSRRSEHMPPSYVIQPRHRRGSSSPCQRGRRGTRLIVVLPHAWGSAEVLASASKN
jgi:hypothetical protein